MNILTVRASTLCPVNRQGKASSMRFDFEGVTWHIVTSNYISVVSHCHLFGFPRCSCEVIYLARVRCAKLL